MRSLVAAAKWSWIAVVAPRVAFVVDDVELLVIGGDPIGDRGGGVGVDEVVDDDQLELGLPGPQQAVTAASMFGVQGALDVLGFRSTSG